MTTLRISLIAAAGFVLAALAPAAAAQQPQHGTGQTAPEFALASLDGQTVRLSQFRDRLVLIHFAATWCPFCNAEAPHLEALHKAYKDKGVQVLILDINEPQQLVARTARKFGFTFPVLLDEDGSVAKSYAPPKNVLPDLARDEVMVASNLLIDKEARIRFFSVLDTKQFDAKLVGLRAVLDQVLAGK